MDSSRSPGLECDGADATCENAPEAVDVLTTTPVFFEANASHHKTPCWESALKCTGPFFVDCGGSLLRLDALHGCRIIYSAAVAYAISV
jgi:hypothetical protein